MFTDIRNFRGVGIVIFTCHDTTIFQALGPCSHKWVRNRLSLQALFRSNHRLKMLDIEYFPDNIELCRGLCYKHPPGFLYFTPIRQLTEISGYPQISARYNPIGDFSRITEVATRISNQLPDQGNSAAFREFAWRFTNIASRALHAMGRKPDYRQITRHITHIDPLLVEYCRQWLPKVAPEGWEQEVARRAGEVNDRNLPLALRGRPPEIVALVQYIKEEGFYDPIADGLRSAFEYDKTYFDKIVASLLPLMEKLISGPTADLIAPDYADTNDARPIFDWINVVRRRGSSTSTSTRCPTRRAARVSRSRPTRRPGRTSRQESGTAPRPARSRAISTP